MNIPPPRSRRCPLPPWPGAFMKQGLGVRGHRQPPLLHEQLLTWAGERICILTWAGERICIFIQVPSATAWQGLMQSVGDSVRGSAPGPSGRLAFICLAEWQVGICLTLMCRRLSAWPAASVISEKRDFSLQKKLSIDQSAAATNQEDRL